MADIRLIFLIYKELVEINMRKVKVNGIGNGITHEQGAWRKETTSPGLCS